MRVCGPDSIEVAAYARCLAQMSEDYSKYLAPGLPRPFYMPNPVPLYRQTLNILEKLIGPNDPEVNLFCARGNPGKTALTHQPALRTVWLGCSYNRASYFLRLTCEGASKG